VAPRRRSRSFPASSSAASSVFVPPMSRPMRSTAGLERLVPGNRQARRAVDEADHAVGLREVAPQLAGGDVEVLGEEPEPVAALERRLEKRARLVAPAERGERIDVPEGADDERVGRRAEVVGLRVAEDLVAAAQILLD